MLRSGIVTNTLYLATRTGLVIGQRENDAWRAVERVLKDQHVTSVIAREGVILAGTKKGVQRSDDGGRTWRSVSDGLTSPHVRWLAYHPDISDLEFAGTEPAEIFVSQDGAEHWQSRPEVARLRDEHGWMLPYSPEAGCVRGFTFHGQRVSAAVDVGGVLRSDDGGQSWALAAGSDGNPDLSGPPEPFVYPDIHDLVVHPSNADLVYAATGGGFYRSDDGGATWALLYDCYCRALWLDANDPDHIIFGPAEQVGAVGRIEESRDGGQSWRPASGSLTVPWPRTMAERITQIDDELFAVLDDGRVLITPLATLDWQFIFDDVRGVNAVTTMRE
jgi:photosystem II stability/assembly factor-like uncharacterized protein